MEGSLRLGKTVGILLDEHDNRHGGPLAKIQGSPFSTTSHESEQWLCGAQIAKPPESFGGGRPHVSLWQSGDERLDGTLIAQLPQGLGCGPPDIILPITQRPDERLDCARIAALAQPSEVLLVALHPVSPNALPQLPQGFGGRTPDFRIPIAQRPDERVEGTRISELPQGLRSGTPGVNTLIPQQRPDERIDGTRITELPQGLGSGRPDEILPIAQRPDERLDGPRIAAFAQPLEVSLPAVVQPSEIILVAFHPLSPKGLSQLRERLGRGTPNVRSPIAQRLDEWLDGTRIAELPQGRGSGAPDARISMVQCPDKRIDDTRMTTSAQPVEVASVASHPFSPDGSPQLYQGPRSVTTGTAIAFAQSPNERFDRARIAALAQSSEVMPIPLHAVPPNGLSQLCQGPSHGTPDAAIAFAQRPDERVNRTRVFKLPQGHSSGTSDATIPVA